MALLIDTHAHLDDNRFDTDRLAMMQRASDGGIVQMIAVGITVASSRACIRLVNNRNVFATVGFHPNEVGDAQSGDWDTIVALANEPGVVALGETGIDRFRDRSPFSTQEDYFVRHLELGRKLNRPIVIHARQADDDIIRLLRIQYDRYGPISGVLHSFTGSANTAAAAISMGLHISIAGMVTYPNAQDVRDMAATIPMNRLLVETDSPYLSPQPLRGKRNEPSFIIHTAKTLANIFGISLDIIAEHTTHNARELFGLPAV